MAVTSACSCCECYDRHLVVPPPPTSVILACVNVSELYLLICRVACLYIYNSVMYALFACMHCVHLAL